MIWKPGDCYTMTVPLHTVGLSQQGSNALELRLETTRRGCRQSHSGKSCAAMPRRRLPPASRHPGRWSACESITTSKAEGRGSGFFLGRPRGFPLWPFRNRVDARRVVIRRVTHPILPGRDAACLRSSRTWHSVNAAIIARVRRQNEWDDRSGFLREVLAHRG